jgi:hypothetical protein
MSKTKRLVTLLFIGIICFFSILIAGLEYASRAAHSAEPSSVSQPNQWKYFSSNEGHFRILFPGTPVETNKTASSGNVSMTMHMVGLDADQHTHYGVLFNDYPESVGKITPQQLFESASRNVAKKYGNITPIRDFKINDLPAKDFEIPDVGRPNTAARLRLILSGQRLYQIMVIFPAGNPHEDDFKTFFDSFSISGNSN